jgi:hypothetical protein
VARSCPLNTRAAGSLASAGLSPEENASRSRHPVRLVPCHGSHLHRSNHWQAADFVAGPPDTRADLVHDRLADVQGASLRSTSAAGATRTRHTSWRPIDGGAGAAAARLRLRCGPRPRNITQSRQRSPLDTQPLNEQRPAFRMGRRAAATAEAVRSELAIQSLTHLTFPRKPLAAASVAWLGGCPSQPAAGLPHGRTQ